MKTIAAACLVITLLCPALARAHCMVGEIPDGGSDCTPGAVASVDIDEICAITRSDKCPIIDGKQPPCSYSKQHRITPVELKREIFERYGVDPIEARKQDWEIDHRLSLALGGADSAANLWPQKGNGFGVCYNFHAKDKLETYLWTELCKRHTVSVGKAQAALLGDWREAYRQYLGEPECPEK